MPQMPTRRPDLLVQDVAGEAVLYDQRDGQTHVLDATANSVLALCDASMSLQDAASRLGLSGAQLEATLEALGAADLLVPGQGTTRRNVLTGAGVVGAGLVLATMRAPMAMAAVSGRPPVGPGPYTPTSYDAYTELNAAPGTPTSDFSFAYLAGSTLGPVAKPYSNFDPASSGRGGSGSVKFVSSGYGNGPDFLGGPGYPLLFVNPSSTTPFVFSSVTLPASSFAVHPATGASAVVTFTVPASVPAGSTATISYSVTDVDPHGGNGVNYYLGTTPGSSDLGSGSYLDAGASGPLSKTTTVNPGDTISLTVDPKSGDYSNDSTALTFTVSV